MNYQIFNYSLICFILLMIISLASYKFNLLDKPNKRKIHTKPVAYTGGLAISLAYLISIKMFYVVGHNLNLIISISFLIAIVGFIDDKFHLNIGGKLSLQIIPTFYLIEFANMSLANIGEYDYFVLNLNTFSLPFTLLCVLFLINAFNYFDGIDGTLSFATLSVIFILFFLAPSNNIKLFLITMFIPILIFLCFNFSLFKLPKLFLGDSGSLCLGFIISFVLIYFANQKITHPILLAYSVSIFVFEFISINVIRIINKKNPFEAGRDHLHHILINKTNSIFFTNFLISVLNIFLFIVGYTSYTFISPLISMIIFIFLFTLYFIIRSSDPINIRR